MTASFFGSLYLFKKNGIYLNVMPFSGEKKETFLCFSANHERRNDCLVTSQSQEIKKVDRVELQAKNDAGNKESSLEVESFTLTRSKCLRSKR